MKRALAGMFGAAVLITAVAVCQEKPRPDALQISESNGEYVLSVPVSRLVMTIPKNGLVRGSNTGGGAAASRRYFYFEDRPQNLFVSGWFESESEFRGIKKFWESETAAWKKKGLPEAQDVSFADIGKWKAILYDIHIPSVNDSHIRAHWVQAGTWIDIHLSMAADRPVPEIRAALRDTLNSIRVEERKGP